MKTYETCYQVLRRTLVGASVAVIILSLPVVFAGHIVAGEDPAPRPVRDAIDAAGAEAATAALMREPSEGVMFPATDCFRASAPVADPLGPKNRYLSFSAGDAGRQQAVAVTFADLPTPFEDNIGEGDWVGEPFLVTELAGSSGSTPEPTFLAAQLQCVEFYTDWSMFGTVHVFGEAIVPGATYAVQVIDSTCDPGDSSNYSDALIVTTSRWGDVVGLTPWSPPDGIVNILDLVSVLDKFKNMPGAVVKVRADLCGNAPPWMPDQIVDFGDVSYWVDAFFKGFPYPFDWPSGGHCGGVPSACGNGVIEYGEECDDGNTTPGDGCDADCQSELCGNGTLDPGEECDDGNTVPGDGCDENCQSEPVCGNTTVEVGEECDDGNTTPGDGCDENCRIEGTAVISLVPVDSDGSYTLNGNEIIMPAGGQRVLLEVRLEGWDPDLDDIPLLKVWQATIDSSGYTSGLGGSLTPYSPACTPPTYPDPDMCIALVGPASSCDVPPAPPTPTNCTPGFQDMSRTDYVNAPCVTPCAGSNGVGISTLDYVYTGFAWWPWGIEEDEFGGGQAYGGTLALDVPWDASGTFTVGFLPGAFDTFMRNQGNQVIGLDDLVPAQITILDPPAPEDSGSCSIDADCNPPPYTAGTAECIDGICYMPKPRYLSFVPRNAGQVTALKVILVDLPPPLHVHNGEVMWVGAPIETTELAGETAPNQPRIGGGTWPDFFAARLCTQPHFMDWGTIGLLHVFDDEIVADATYEVRAANESLAQSLPLTLATTVWGDLSGGFDPVLQVWTPPDGDTGFLDIPAVVDKFKNLPTAPIKARTDLAGDSLEWGTATAPNRVVDFVDISAAVDAYKGGDYPYVIDLQSAPSPWCP